MEGKKSSLILVLKVLEEYSDEEHFLTQQEIIDKIDETYGVSLERKSVANCISLLQELDYDIVKGPHGGFALFSRLFDPSEVQYITDALFSAKSISAKHAEEIANRAQSTLSKHQKKKYNYIHKATQMSRTDSKEVFYAIDTVHEGIRRGKRISFQLRCFDEHGRPSLRMDGYRYKVSPYYLINSNGYYYLLCNYREKYAPFNIFRVDFMTDLQIEEDWPIKPIEALKDVKDFDIAKYVNEHIYMLGGDTVDAVLRIERVSGIQALKDWFGSHAKIKEKEGVLYASIKCNEKALLYWLLQYGEEFTLLEPSSTIDKLKAYLKIQVDKYGDLPDLPVFYPN